MAEPANQMHIKVFNVSANFLPEMKMMRLTTTELAFFRLGKITKMDASTGGEHLRLVAVFTSTNMI